VVSVNVNLSGYVLLDRARVDISASGRAAALKYLLGWFDKTRKDISSADRIARMTRQLEGLAQTAAVEYVKADTAFEHRLVLNSEQQTLVNLIVAGGLWFDGNHGLKRELTAALLS